MDTFLHPQQQRDLMIPETFISGTSRSRNGLSRTTRQSGLWLAVCRRSGGMARIAAKPCDG